MNELELRQMFKNLYDCYADTWLDIGTNMIEGEVIQAMTEDRFIEALKQANLLVIPAVSNNEEKEKLKFRLNFLFNIYSQQELAEELKITQWKLLTKIKDNSFSNKEILLIEKICNEFKNK